MSFFINSVYLSVVLLLAVEQSTVLCRQSGIGCRDNHGNPVDWFIVYKLPRLEDSASETVRDGTGQLYMDVNKQEWRLLDEPITDDKCHAVVNTLQQIYDNHLSKDVAYVMYSDQVPDTKNYSEIYGHTKGDLCFDKTSGFWLVHSVPRFPRSSDKQYAYYDGQKKYGQMLFCVTYGYDQFNAIGRQLLYNYPQIYDHNLPDSLARDNPNIQRSINDEHVNKEPWYHEEQLTSLSGQTFTSFAKFTDYGKDLYNDWLAPHYKSDLYVETWQHSHVLPSECGQYKVLNVDDLKVSGETFTNWQDHSKWATTIDGDVICIGGINREETQKERAGGTVCSSLPGVAAQFQRAVVNTKPCEKERNDEL